MAATSTLSTCLAAALLAGCAGSAAPPARSGPRPVPAPSEVAARSATAPASESTEQVLSTDLPLLEVPPELATGEPPTAGAPAREIGVDTLGLNETYRLPYGPRTVALRPMGTRIGRVRIAGDGELVECGGVAGPLPISWETVTVSPTSEVTFTLSDGWLDTRSCSATARRSRSTTARALLGGALYAFRERVEGGGERVTLLLPRARVVEERLQGRVSVDPGSITHVSIGLEPGTVAAALLQVGRLDLARWRAGLGPLRGTQHLEPTFEGTLGVPSRLVAVELVQVQGDRAVIGAYLEPLEEDEGG